MTVHAKESPGRPLLAAIAAVAAVAVGGCSSENRDDSADPTDPVPLRHRCPARRAWREISSACATRR